MSSGQQVDSSTVDQQAWLGHASRLNTAYSLQSCLPAVNDYCVTGLLNTSAERVHNSLRHDELMLGIAMQISLFRPERFTERLTSSPFSPERIVL